MVVGRLCRGLAALALLASLLACGGGGPAPQTPAAIPELQGTVTGGDTTGDGEVALNPTARGVQGIARTATTPLASRDYRVRLSELDGPYALRALARSDGIEAEVYGLALEPGVANITPLTTLMIAQLYGEDPGAVFDDWGPGSARPARATPQALADAQAAVRTFLEDELSLALPPGLRDFVTTPFEAEAGDPHYDTVLALQQALAARGETVAGFVATAALASRLCQTERVVLEIGADAVDFCPLTKTANRGTLDATVIVHEFTDRRGNRLRMRVRDDTLLSAAYLSADGTARWDCLEAVCTGITLGTPEADETRALIFSDATLPGRAGSNGQAAVANGQLQSAIPGVELPVLPCDTNRFTLVLPDRSVSSACYEPDPDGFGIGATLGGSFGVDPPRRTATYSLNLQPDPLNPQIELLMDADGQIDGVEFRDFEAGEFVARRRFVCLFEGCASVTVTPGRRDLTFGPADPLIVRTANFTDTVLQEVDEFGQPTGRTATLRASLTYAYFTRLPARAYPEASPCAAGEATHSAQTDDGSAFNVCTSASGVIFADEPTPGQKLLSAGSLLASTVEAVVRDGRVVQLSLGFRSGFTEDGEEGVSVDFFCAGACAGVSLTEPDAAGRRRLRFDGAVLSERLFFQSPVAGVRTITLDSDVEIVFEPPP